MHALFDVNTLLALTDVRHPQHARARSWRRDHLGDTGWASCPLTQNGFVRIVTQKSYPAPLSMSEPLSMLDRLTRRPEHAFWPDDISLLDESHIDPTRLLGPRQITDVYLLALAVAHGGRLVTLDASISIRAARKATPANLVVI